MKRAGDWARIAVLCFALGPASALALVVGQIDTFQDLTTDGWFAGGLGAPGQIPAIPPHVVATGGTAGAGDAYLEITSAGGNGPGSRLVAINATQWAGDYASSGIGLVSMDVANLGGTDLVIRLLFEDPMGAPPVDEAVTTTGFALPVGSGWQHVLFPIGAADFTVLRGNIDDLLANTTLVRIIDAPTATEAVAIVGVLGVDNIAAAPGRQLPTPASLSLIAAALLAWAACARRSRFATFKVAAE